VRPVYDSFGNSVPNDVFTAACNKSHRMVTRVDVLFQGSTVQEDLRVSGGTVTIDRKAEHAGRCTVKVVDPLNVPTINGRLMPVGYEIQVKRGIRVAARWGYETYYDILRSGDGSIITDPQGGVLLAPDSTPDRYGTDTLEIDWMTSLGVFGIRDGKVTGATMQTDINGWDRSMRVSDDKLTEPIIWTAGVGTLEDQVLALIQRTWGSSIGVSVSGTTHPTPGITHEDGADPWAAAIKAANGVGYETGWTGTGQWFWRPEPSYASDAHHFHVHEGEGGVLLTVDPSYNINDAYNMWKVVGNNPGDAGEFVGIAYDNDPSSPTRWGGPLWRKPAPVERSTVVLSTAAAQAAAEAKRDAQSGVMEDLNFTMITNPSIEPGDLTHIMKSSLNINKAVIMDSQVIGLGPEDPMSCNVRSKVI
jgi:hypothetical protein